MVVWAVWEFNHIIPQRSCAPRLTDAVRRGLCDLLPETYSGAMTQHSALHRTVLFLGDKPPLNYPGLALVQLTHVELCLNVCSCFAPSDLHSCRSQKEASIEGRSHPQSAALILWPTCLHVGMLGAPKSPYPNLAVLRYGVTGVSWSDQSDDLQDLVSKGETTD